MTRGPTHASLRLAFGAAGFAAIRFAGFVGGLTSAEKRRDRAGEKSKKNGKFFHGPTSVAKGAGSQALSRAWRFQARPLASGRLLGETARSGTLGPFVLRRAIFFVAGLAAGHKTGQRHEGKHACDPMMLFHGTYCPEDDASKSTGSSRVRTRVYNGTFRCRT